MQITLVINLKISEEPPYMSLIPPGYSRQTQNGCAAILAWRQTLLSLKEPTITVSATEPLQPDTSRSRTVAAACLPPRVCFLQLHNRQNKSQTCVLCGCLFACKIIRDPFSLCRTEGVGDTGGILIVGLQVTRRLTSIIYNFTHTERQLHLVCM